MQKKIFLKILVFFFFIFSVNANTIEGFAEIIDGDTLRLNNIKIRLYGIDAPEINQKCYKQIFAFNFFSYNKKYYCGKKTSKELQIFLKNSKIVCQIKGQDRYKRKIAICFKNSIDINAWLVKEGLAVAYKKYSRRYSNFEKQARDQKKGIWNGQFDMPWDWRKKKNKL